jgi:hypothetical protein
VRDRERLLNIIEKQANLIERLAHMINSPIYLFLHASMRKEIHDSSMTAVHAAHRVVTEERAS